MIDLNGPQVEALGRASIAGSDDCGYSVVVDRLAVDKDGRIYLMSCIGSSSTIKGVHAWLSTNARGFINIWDVEFSNGRSPIAPSYLVKVEGGYYRYPWKLGFDQWHAVFVSKADGFLTNISDQSLWHELKSSRFTTPVLREWVPYLRSVFEEQKLLLPAYCFQCQCGGLNLDTKRLDQIVKEGLSRGLIEVPAKRMSA
jgi:hypothetical protein